jgi:N6-adenosine-specific RNA methylase IME4
MAKRTQDVVPVRPIVIGHYTLHETGIAVKGTPNFAEHEGVGAFINRAAKASRWWRADWMRYGESRADWQTRLSQVIHHTGLSEKTLKNERSVAAIEPSRRRDDVEFELHAAVAGLSAKEQSFWLEEVHSHGWGLRELRLELRAAKRRRIIEGQATLMGQYRALLVDFPWIYGNKPPSGSGAQQHYPGISIEDGCKLPVEAHAMKHAVMFFWVTAPFLYYASDGLTPDPYRLIRAWGFTPKTGMVWDKGDHNFGNYVSVRHEHLLICTRGSCTPDRPTPMFDSVFTERQTAEHSGKPELVRAMIERLYDGPYLELFGRERHEGWDVFGNDARLWAEEKASA